MLKTVCSSQANKKTMLRLTNYKTFNTRTGKITKNHIYTNWSIRLKTETEMNIRNANKTETE